MAHAFFEEAARAILARHEDELPDLRRAVVLLPNHHAAQPLIKALAAAANTPALLLPKIITLREWAQSVTLETEVVPDTRRAATLYKALRVKRWFQDADLWGITSELLSLMDELTLCAVALPQSEEDFITQLERAYEARRSSFMQFEARVVHELWYAMSAGAEMDAVRAYQGQLARLAKAAEVPLYVFTTSELAAVEAHFLEVYAKRAPVTVFDLREMMRERKACAPLNFLAPHGDAESDIRRQVERLRAEHPDAALNNRLRLFAAHSLEEEARAAELQVRRWLVAGKTNIAIVAQDRLVARRVRALLERAGVLVQDETGWKLSTLSVSTVLMRWLDVLQSDFYYQDLLDLLKSPFIFADQPAGERKRAVYQFEQLVRRHGVASHLAAYLDMVTQAENPGGFSVQTALARVKQGAEALGKSTNTLGGWLGALHASLDILGVAEGLKRDAAGEQLLQSLQGWREELAQDATRFSRAEWRHWLALQLDCGTFSDTSIESPVRLTSLAAMRWRSFDAVLILGAGADHLPSDAGSLWFNDAVRAALGLSTRAARTAQQRDDLMALLAMNDTVLATWRKSQGGEENLLSPYFELLRALNREAYADDLEETQLRAMLDAAAVRPEEFALPERAAMPAPVIAPARVPMRVSVSAYNSLVECPYKFYARHVLRLNELDEVQEEIQKRDYGEWVHGILCRFHGQFPELSRHPHEELEEALRAMSREGFAPAIERDFYARAWLMRWEEIIPEYIKEQLQSEAAGWRYENGEAKFELQLAGDLVLHGRTDRVDARDGARRVLDYKLKAVPQLQKSLAEAGEDVQLPVYAYAHGADEAAFLSMERSKVKPVAPPQDVPELASGCIERLVAVIGQVRQGAPLPAHGADEVCEHCEMHGLCRKAEWA